MQPSTFSIVAHERSGKVSDAGLPAALRERVGRLIPSKIVETDSLKKYDIIELPS